jgi:hypothetical protein
LGSRYQIDADESCRRIGSCHQDRARPSGQKPLWVSTRTLAFGAPVTAAAAPPVCEAARCGSPIRCPPEGSELHLAAVARRHCRTPLDRPD